MRRFLAAILCAALLCMAASAETFAVSTGEGALLLTDAGEALTQWGEYATLYRLSGADCPEERALFMAAPVLSSPPEGAETGEAARAYLLDARGKRLNDEMYTTANHIPEAGVAVVWQGEWAGAIDETGAELLPCAYGGVIPDGEGGFLATPRASFAYDADGYPVSARLWHFGADGAATDTGLDVQPYLYGAFSDGLAPVQVLTGALWRYGYINSRGELAIEPAFDYAEEFRDGFAAARTLEGKMGLLRADGTWALEPVYDDIGYLWGQGDAFYALRGGSVEILERETLAPRATHTFEYVDYIYAYEVDGALVIAVADGALTAISMDGEILFRGEVDSLSISSSFIARTGAAQRLVCATGVWPEQEYYLTDLRLRPVAGPYTSIESGLWWKDGEGRFLVCDYELYEETFDGESYTYPLASSYVYGVIDQDGNEVLPMAWNTIQYLSPQRYWARRGETWSMIDETGNVYFEISQYVDLMD